MIHVKSFLRTCGTSLSQGLKRSLVTLLFVIVVAHLLGPPLSALTCDTTGEQKILVLLAAFPGTEIPDLSVEQARDIFFSIARPSVAEYWKEASYGKVQGSGAVFGWFTLDRPYALCRELHETRLAVIKAADSEVDFRDYNRVFVILPTSDGTVGNCNFGGRGENCFNHSSADGDFLASFSWFVVNGYDHVPAVYLAVHEGGHSLGIDHARSRSYDSETLGPLNVRGTVAEYGDPFSAMGRFGLGHYSARQKQSVGWLTESDVQTVEGNGTFTISPLSMNSEGLKALRIRRGAGNDAWLWLEYRQPTGNYESTLPGQGFTGALIHYEDLHTKTRAGTFLLDFTPNSTNEAGNGTIDPDFLDPALAVGKTWSDSYTNRSIEILTRISNLIQTSRPSGGLERLYS